MPRRRNLLFFWDCYFPEALISVLGAGRTRLFQDMNQYDEHILENTTCMNPTKFNLLAHFFGHFKDSQLFPIRLHRWLPQPSFWSLRSQNGFLKHITTSLLDSWTVATNSRLFSPIGGGHLVLHLVFHWGHWIFGKLQSKKIQDILEAWNLRTWFSGFFSGDSCETWFLNFRKDNKGDERNMSKK